MSELTTKIRDNIHGQIAFESCFDDILTSKFFKRLHRITQMGMARQVFPAAVHTRFSHSLGVYQNMKRMIESNGLKTIPPNNEPLSQRDQFFLLTSALLHDIGHLPLSHTVEKALERYEKRKNRVQATPANKSAVADLLAKGQTMLPGGEPLLDGVALHEQLSAEVIKTTEFFNKVKKAFSGKKGKGHDQTVDLRLITYGILGKSEEINVNTAEINPLYQLAKFLLHSQIDADRLDYLLRDSATAGIKTGGFDVDCLINEIKVIFVNDEYKYGITLRGLRSFEEYLLTRAYNYLEIVYDAEMYGLGLLAEEFYYQLLLLKENNNIKNEHRDKILSFAELRECLRSGIVEKFLSFDDDTYRELVELARGKNGGLFCCSVWEITEENELRSAEIIKAMAEMLSDGQAPQLLWRRDMLASEDEYKKLSRINGEHDDGSLNTSYQNDALQNSGLVKEQLLISDKKSRIKLYDNSEHERVCLIGENERLLEDDFANSTSSIFNAFKDANGSLKCLYVDVVYSIVNCSEEQISNYISAMEK